MARVGVIGLGTMGAPMARNLLKGGHAVTVFARRTEAMAPLIAAGATPAASPADVASRSEFIVTMVLNTQAVEDVVLGPGGVVEGARAESVVIDHSTIEPGGARQIAAALQARGVHMLDAPVSGGAAVTEARALSIMVGGDERTLDRARPILACYGRTIVHIGPSGAGQVAKACNQICTIVNTLGVAEAMLLAERAGVDAAKVKDVLMTGFGASRMLELLAPKIIARDFEGKVESRLHFKDIHIVLDMARALGIELPACQAAARVLTTLQERGGGRRDTAAVFEVLDR